MKRNHWWYHGVKWKTWLFGVAIDRELHWYSDQLITSIEVYVGPLMIGVEHWGKEK